MNVNGRKSDMAAQNFQNLRNLQNLQKTDKSGLVGEAQKATAADNRPEGNTGAEDRVIKHGTGNLRDGFTVDGGLNPDDKNIVLLVDTDGTVLLVEIWTDENGNIKHIWQNGKDYDYDSDQTRDD